MDKQGIIKTVKEYIENCDLNYVQKDIALSEELVGMKIFDDPIFAFGSADDEGFNILKNESVIGEHFFLPKDWLPEANTVISYFLPFTDTVIKSNREDKNWPSSGWLHGRIEGQKLLNSLNKYLCDTLVREGYKTIVPTQDSRFWSSTENHEIKDFTSNYSERHVAFVCGLGTFGLSKGIITEKGMAGRLGSVITSLKLEPSEKKYKDIYENCIMCGACIRRCPVKAISLENGKKHPPCSRFLDSTMEKFKPRYGCGKCQVAVPCERKIPKK